MSQIVNKMRNLMSTVVTLLMPKGYTDVESVNRFPPGPKMFAATFEATALSIRAMIFSGPILTAFAIFMGFNILQISLALSLIELMSFTGNFGIWLSKKTSSKKRFSFGFMSIAVLVSGLMPFLLGVKEPTTRFLLFLIILAIRSGSYNIGGAIWCDWVGSQENHPQGIRLLKKRTRVILIASVTTLFIGSLIIQTLPEIAGKIPIIGQILVYYGAQISAFATVFWSATIIILVGFVPQVTLTEEYQYKTGESVDIKSTIRMLIVSNYRLLLIITIPIGASFHPISSLLFFHAQKDLQVTLVFSAFLLISTLLTSFFTKTFWQYLASRFGMKPVLRFICLTGAVVIPISAFLATTQTPAFLFITAVFIGLCASGINAILPGFLVKLVPADKQAEVFAVVSSFIGFGASLGIAIAGLTMHFAGQNALPTFLGIQVLPYHFTGIEGAVFFLLAFFIGYKITEPDAARLRDLVMYLVRRAIRLGKEEPVEEKTKDSSDNSKEDK